MLLQLILNAFRKSQSGTTPCSQQQQLLDRIVRPLTDLHHCHHQRAYHTVTARLRLCRQKHKGKLTQLSSTSSASHNGSSATMDLNFGTPARLERQIAQDLMETQSEFDLSMPGGDTRDISASITTLGLLWLLPTVTIRPSRGHPTPPTYHSPLLLSTLPWPHRTPAGSQSLWRLRSRMLVSIPARALLMRLTPTPCRHPRPPPAYLTRRIQRSFQIHIRTSEALRRRLHLLRSVP